MRRCICINFNFYPIVCVLVIVVVDRSFFTSLSSESGIIILFLCTPCAPVQPFQIGLVFPLFFLFSFHFDVCFVYAMIFVSHHFQDVINNNIDIIYKEKETVKFVCEFHHKKMYVHRKSKSESKIINIIKSNMLLFSFSLHSDAFVALLLFGFVKMSPLQSSI